MSERSMIEDILGRLDERAPTPQAYAEACRSCWSWSHQGVIRSEADAKAWVHRKTTPRPVWSRGGI